MPYLLLPYPLPLKCKNMAEQDIKMNQFQIVTDADYVYVEKGNSQGKIKKTDLINLLSAAFTILTLGDDEATNGSLWISGKYSRGIMSALGTRYSTGNVCILKGIRNIKGDKWVSTTNIILKRFVYEFSENGVNIGYSSDISVPVGEEVQLTWKKISFTE